MWQYTVTYEIPVTRTHAPTGPRGVCGRCYRLPSGLRRGSESYLMKSCCEKFIDHSLLDASHGQCTFLSEILDIPCSINGSIHCYSNVKAGNLQLQLPQGDSKGWDHEHKKEFIIVSIRLFCDDIRPACHPLPPATTVSSTTDLHKLKNRVDSWWKLRNKEPIAYKKG